MHKTEYKKTVSSHLRASAALVCGAASLLLSFTGATNADALTNKGDEFVGRALWGSADGPRVSAPSGWSSVVVRLSGRELTAAQRAKITALGGYVYRNLPIIDSVAVRVPSRRLRELAEQSFVQRISADATVIKNDEFTVEHTGADVALSQYSLTGKGVTIAVLDSGVDPQHVDLRTADGGVSRVVAQVNVSGDGGRAADPLGHGTHVAGIIAGNGAASTGRKFFRTFYGVAREANIASVKVLDRDGQGTVSSVIAGMQWVYFNRSRYNIRVMNLSLGHPVGESYKTDPLCRASEYLWKAGIVVVCAAGNEGRREIEASAGHDNEGFGTKYGSIQSPANSPFVITVGATKASPQGRAGDRIATYSSRGPSRIDLVMKPDIVAPGNRIISVNSKNSTLDGLFGGTNRVKMSEYTNTKGDKISNTYFRLSGTSMAAPVVSGAAALLLQKDPALTPDSVKARLMISADKWTLTDGTADPLTFGAGYLNIPAALGSSVVAHQSALSPPLALSPGGFGIHIDPSRIIWGGTEEIWGILGVRDLRIIWGGASLEEFNTLVTNPDVTNDTVWTDRVIWDITNSEVDLSSKTIYGEN